jgi:hypothetical protein
MPPPGTCPLCAGSIEWTIIKGRCVRCPHCGELLREATHADSAVACCGIAGLITLGVLTRQYGLIGWVLILYVAYPLAMILAYTVVTLVFGPTLEPVPHAGHIPLGESEE